MLVKRYFFFMQCAILYQQCNIVTALIGNVRQAEENEFPSVVSIRRYLNATYPRIERFHLCTGTLVSRQDLVTAEHCVRSTFTQGFQVMIGSHDLRQTIAFFPLFIWTYEHWATFRRREIEYTDHDIALVKLATNIPETIEFSPYGNIENNLLYGMDVVAAGWGRKEDDEVPRFLQTGTMRVMTHTNCEIRHRIFAGYTVSIDRSRLCSVGDPHVVLTEGDSGGPLFFFGSLIGINSGIFPDLEGPVQLYSINLHYCLRYYQDYFQDVITTFHMNF